MNRQTIALAAVILVVVLGIGGVVAYTQVLQGDNVAPLGLDAVTPSGAGAEDHGALEFRVIFARA